MMDDKKLDEILNRSVVPEFDPSGALKRAVGQIEAMDGGQNVVSFKAKANTPMRSKSSYSYVGGALVACLALAFWVNVNFVQTSSSDYVDDFVTEMAVLEAEQLVQEQELLGLFDVAKLEIRDENVDIFIEELYLEEQNEMEFWDSLTDG